MKDITEITEKLEKGVKDLFASEDYAAYLAFMGRFHNYSVNNSILIWLQMPTASLVAGYKAWQTKFNRQVKKGEKGIMILAPCPHKFMKRDEDEDGNVTERVIEYTTFRATSVFDISQTEGDPVPTIKCRTLAGEVENYEKVLEALKAVSPVPVGFEDIKNGSHGYFSPSESRIAVKAGMSEQQTIKTLVHEIGHAILHCKGGDEEQAKRGTKEVQAESVAYTVCAYLGLDTSDYSFGYVAGWSEGQEPKELTASMEVIRKTAVQIIEGIEAA